MNRFALLALCGVISSVVFAQQNPNLNVGANSYNLGFGSAPVTCFDGSHDTKNNCVAKWINSNLRVGNTNITPVCTGSSTTACVNYYSSVPYLMNLYWIRDAVGAAYYENAILHFTQDAGFLSLTYLYGQDQFDFFNQTHGLTEGISYYIPNEAADGVLLQNGTTYTDITQWVYGGAVTAVAYANGIFTLTGTPSENFTNITSGKTITLTGFTRATFLNGKTATVSTVSGTTTPIMTFSLTCSANCTGTNETGYVANAQVIPAGDSLLLGYMEPFDEINVRLAMSQVGGSVTYQYSTGSGTWGILSSAPNWSDGTGGLTSGLASSQIGFYPPTDWATDTINGNRAKFWVKITPTGATRQPSIFNLRGDNLKSTLVSPSQCGTVTGCLVRGWSAAAYAASTACGGSPCVVAGGYPYNPNPPLTSSARFPYQARSGGYGSHANNFWLNPSTVDNDGNPLAGTILPYLWLVTTQALGGNPTQENGTMFDNAASNITRMYPAWNPNLTDLECAPGSGGAGCSESSGNSSWDNYWVAALARATSLMHASYGSSFMVTGNVASNWSSTLATVGPSLDLSWLENPMLVTDPGNGNGTAFDPHYTFDLGRSGMNVSVAEIDSNIAGFCDTMYNPCVPFVWNRGARGSMNALGNHYLFSNAHTVLTYSIGGMSLYDYADQYYYFTNATTLTAPMSRGVFPTPFTFSVASTTPLVATANPSCQSPGCGGTDNPYAGKIFVRICPTTNTCYEGDVFQVTINGPNTVSINANASSKVALANSYTGTETVQIAQYGHQAYTLPASMPSWQNVMVYATAAPAFRVDPGMPDTTNGWQPPNGNCGYTTCNRGDRDMFYGAGCTTLHCSAQQWSALPCVNGQYHSPLAGGALRDCSPLARRDYTNAIVLLRTARTGGTAPSAPEEWTTYSNSINLSSFEQRCAPYCVYYRLRADGTTDPGTSNLNLRGAETAIMMKTPVTH